MKHKLNIFCMVLVAGLFINSCTPDFIEPNISSKTIQLISPGNGVHTGVATQTFWWSALSGAEQYDLQVVEGTFISPTELVLDTIVTTNKYTFTLFPGNYQWRVQGINNGYTTAFTTYSFTVDTNTNMTAQTVVLVAPPNNSWTNNLIATFKWDSIPGATSYMLQIINQTNLNIAIDTTVKKEPFTIALPADGKYTWQVRAQNNSSNSPYSSYTIGIDTTTPSTPMLLTPKDDSATASVRVTLTWSTSAGSLSPVMDSIYIYANSFMTALIKDTLTSLTSYSDSSSAGTYYWRVRAISAAGNKSAYSSLFNFTTP